MPRCARARSRAHRSATSPARSPRPRFPTCRACGTASARGRCRVGFLGRLDQSPHVVLAAGSDELDRVGVAVYDPLEELLAVLIRGEGGFTQPRDIVQNNTPSGRGAATALPKLR